MTTRHSLSLGSFFVRRFISYPQMQAKVVLQLEGVLVIDDCWCRYVMEPTTARLAIMAGTFVANCGSDELLLPWPVSRFICTWLHHND